MRVPSSLLALAFVLAGLGAAPADAATPDPVPDPVGPAVVAASDGPTYRLDGDTVVGAQRRAAPAHRIRLWPINTIRYYETIPDEWQWSLDDAVAHWNGTGANLKLVRTTSRKNARLFIRYGPTGGADGIGTLGYAWPSQNFVNLSTAYKHVDSHDPAQRAWVSHLFAHEIGHNLGYNHVSRPRCALMLPVFYFGQCGPLSADKPGYYQCRYIDKPLLKRHIHNYGGRAKQPPLDCPLAPLPPALDGLELTGGGVDTDSVVTVRWSARGQPAGARVTVRSWSAASCGTIPRSARVDVVAATKEEWVDKDKGQGHWCYAVEVANRYGAARAPVTLDVTRERPAPAEPTIGTLSYDADNDVFQFTATLPAGSDLFVQRDYDNPETCLTTYDENAVEGMYSSDGHYEFYADSSEQCLVFFAVAGDGRHSAGVVRHASVPAPPTPTILSVTRQDEGYAYEVEASAQGFSMLGVLVAGDCPATFPEYADYYLHDGQPEYFYPEGEGPHCLALVAEDKFERRGPMATYSVVVTFDEG